MKLSVPNGINMDAHVGWCPGCGHGIVVRLVAEAARDLGIEENIIMVEDVACGEFAQNVLKFNTIGAAHGRPIITAAGAKRTRPDAIVQRRSSIMAWDDVAGKAAGNNGDKYVVLQVVLTEKLLGTGSGTASLTNLQSEINKQAAKGYRLHTISTTSSGSKGFLGGDKIQATMVFERID